MVIQKRLYPIVAIPHKVVKKELVVMEINNFYIGFIGLAVFIFTITIMFYIWAVKFDKKYLAKE